ncbi:MAG: hypothetical protein ACON4M_00535 [Crocinitomicaceae bacterium]
MGFLTRSLILSLLFFSINIYAASEEKLVSAFHERFEVVKKDGKTTKVLDRFIQAKFDIRPYVAFIKQSLIEEQKRMQAKGDYDQEIREMVGKASTYDKGQEIKYAPIVIDSLRELEDLDVETIFNDPKFQEVVNYFEGRINEGLSLIGLNVIANLEDPTFFYKRNVTYEAVKAGLSLAKRILSSVPVLNTASYVLVEVERLIRERRHFHQNMVMHYFENVAPEKLEMTHDEVSKAWSSIYEFQIPWYAKWESDSARANWKKYGPNKFYTFWRMASGRLRQFRGNYIQINERLNFAFNKAVDRKNNEVIINLFDTENALSGKPSVAFYVNDPGRVLRMRFVYTIAELGLSFVPIPQFIKDLGSSFLKSQYSSHKITEGALYAHFETENNIEMMDRIMAQNLNPFEFRFKDAYQTVTGL